MKFHLRGSTHMTRYVCVNSYFQWGHPATRSDGRPADVTIMVRQNTYTISEALPLTDDVVSVRTGGMEFSRIAEIRHWGNEAGRPGDVVRGIFGNCTG